MEKGSLIVRVTKMAESSVVNQLIQLVEQAQSIKAPIQQFADRVARWFVPGIVCLAFATWVFWFTYVYTRPSEEFEFPNGKRKFEFAFDFGVSTLMVACPCALGLATPTAVMVGTGVAAKFGILLKEGGSVLQKMQSITTVIFDKTGTLTHGELKVKQTINTVKKFKVEIP